MLNYTIIIPHKNIPHLLQKCLDSIPRRNDVQIIVVDDNSDSDLVDFNNFPGLNDPYIEVIFGKNEKGRKGAGYARNLGLEKAKGKWLIFADADDFFMPCFNDVLDKHKDDENDIIFFRVNSVYSDTLEPAKRHQSINDWLDKIQLINNWDLCYLLHNPVGKFIKRNIVEKNNIIFNEVQCANDVFFGVKTINAAVSKKISEEIIYCITTRVGSLTTKVSKRELLDRFTERYKSYIFLKKKRINKQLTINLTNSLCYYWMRISRVSISQSILLVPKMINACGVNRGIRTVAYHLIKNDVYGYKRIFKRIKI